jgi:uncharacterized protein (DUF2252 family)
VAKGRALRTGVPRSWLGRWAADAEGRDPISLIEESNVARLPELVPVRHGRMAISPFAFLRGSPIVMTSDLATTPYTSIEVQASGDAHLENFGAYATPERQLVFDLNDFDETAPGPWEWDLKRLVVSVVVAARTAGVPEAEARLAARSTAATYRAVTRLLAGSGHLDSWFSVVRPEELLPNLDEVARRDTEAVVARARRKTTDRAVSKLTVLDGGSLRIRDEPPLITHIDEPELIDRVHGALARYRSSIAPEVRELIDRYDVVDFAVKVVGVGSVGTRCYVMLMRGRDDADHLFLQVKEAQVSVVEQFHKRAPYSHSGERVVVGQRTMQAASDPFLGWTTERGRHFYVRQLWDMKGSVDALSFDGGELESYGKLCGWTLARAHARSADCAAVAAYLGAGDRADRAFAEFGWRYADTIERDYETFTAAIASGRISAETGV